VNYSNIFLIHILYDLYFIHLKRLSYMIDIFIIFYIVEVVMNAILGHNSPLYGRPEEEAEDSPGYHWNSNFSAHFWLEGGAKKSQLLLGMAAYGRGFMLANEVYV
jgi:GH18 family chitinase